MEKQHSQCRLAGLREFIYGMCDLAHIGCSRAGLPMPNKAKAEDMQMLAEKFLLLLETLRSHPQSDGSPRVVSTSPHIPVQLPRLIGLDTRTKGQQ